MRPPRELEGRTVGVTGLPSDEAVVDSEVQRRRRRPRAGRPGHDRVQRGLRRSPPAGSTPRPGSGTRRPSRCASSGVPNRVFKVNRYGAPPYPELILTASRKTIDEDPDLVDAMVEATTRGYRFALERPRPRPSTTCWHRSRRSTAATRRPSCGVLRPDLEPAPLDPEVLDEWAAWDLEHGLLERPLDVEAAFRLPG